MRRGLPAYALSGLLLLWSNGVLPARRWSPHQRAAANVVVGVAAVGACRLMGVERAELRLEARSLPAGVRMGLVASAAPTVAYVVIGATPWLRKKVTRDVKSRREIMGWVVFHIPMGTVLCEELAFRSALSALWARALGDRDRRATSPAQLAGAITFGLWHIAPARAAGDPVVATVLFTTAAGLVFDRLAQRSGSVAAPMILHAAVNMGGALVATRRAPLRGAPPNGGLP
ncbi:CPBP family intramembrane glutamic endopeptidase [Hoyosella subflava]|uniref:Abortive infection protein n=1 Tax=Hoyosella subflava (strain DSM 45089 / JCM 17490 / NBRC 109087 / DQS3-9A1) TaxID=443218 RepID=F6EKH9_HOYSD|nr:CPBP family intramembrane glutamic endopeptidase [Hoyosella subflava]AEF39150.1 Abortive infection protein [Hoyosella subflava DQS3-9A1]